MDKYCGVSEQIYRILHNFTPLVEPISIDEAFLDISQTYQLFADSAYNACSVIKSRIKHLTGLTASIGLAPIKMAAKIASDLKKPDGLVEVKNGRVLEFLWPLDVSRIWGVGKKSQQRLNEIGIHSIGDLARRDVRELIGLLGKNGVYLWELANGRDESQVQAKEAAKSISNEVTFAEDTSDEEKVESVLMYLCEKVSMRLRREEKKCRTITLKIRLKNFQTYTRSVTVAGGTNLVDILNLRVKQLYHDFISSGQDIRLVGVKAADLSSIDADPGLFPEKSEIKKENVHKAVDKIRCKFGDDSIVRAARKLM
jgi:nucleotidyltransferase/DNA polymerase involved in DNA repair